MPRSNVMSGFVVGVLATAALVSAQLPLVERVNVSVVNVDVSVFDRSGRPVTKLRRDDFQIFEDGKPQKITNFYIVEHSVPRAETTQQEQTHGSESRFRRKAILLVDNIFIEKPRRDAALATVQKFMEGRFAGDYEWSVGTIGSGIHTILPFTSDKTKIAAAIDLVRRGGTLPKRDAVDLGMLADETALRAVRGARESEQTRTDLARSISANEGLAALSELAKEVIDACRGYSSADGKKLIVLVTGAIEIDNRRPTIDDAVNQPAWKLQPRENRSETGRILEAMVREANTANFNVYVLNASGVVNPVPSDVSNHASEYVAQGGFNSPHTERDFDSFPLSLAMQTGGAYLPSNDLGASLRQVDEESSTYYSLGYSPPHFEDGKYHSIEVRVTGSAMTVRHRMGYADLSAEQRVEDAMRVAVAPTALPHQIPVQIEIGKSRQENHKMHLPVTLIAPMRSVALLPRDGLSVGRVHIYLSVFDQAGINIGFDHRTQDLALTPEQLQKVTELNSNFRYFLSVALKPGKYRVVVALRDDVSSEIGITAADVQV